LRGSRSIQGVSARDTPQFRLKIPAGRPALLDKQLNFLQSAALPQCKNLSLLRWKPVAAEASRDFGCRHRTKLPADASSRQSLWARELNRQIGFGTRGGADCAECCSLERWRRRSRDYRTLEVTKNRHGTACQTYRGRAAFEERADQGLPRGCSEPPPCRAGSRCPKLKGKQVILIHDLITTGSCYRLRRLQGLAAADMLKQQGATVLGAIVAER
jgi:hypothetical protein